MPDLSTQNLQTNGGTGRKGTAIATSIPTDGLVFTESFIRQMTGGAKQVLVKSRPFKINGRDLLLVTRKSAVGIIRLSSPSKINLKQFLELESQHRITTAERKKWWPTKKSFWAYRIVSLKLFANPIDIEPIVGPHIIVRNIKLDITKAPLYFELTKAESDALANYGAWLTVLSSKAKKWSDQTIGLISGPPSVVEVIRDFPRKVSEFASSLSQAHGGEAGNDASFLKVLTEAQSWGKKALSAIETSGPKDLASGIRESLEELSVISRVVNALEKTEEDSVTLDLSKTRNPDMALPVDKKLYSVLKMPSPRFNLEKLCSGESSGFLSKIELDSPLGEERVVVNEINKLGEKPYAFGIVRMRDGHKFAGVGRLPKEIASGIDEFTMRKFQSERSFWYYPLEFVRGFSPSIELKQSVSDQRFSNEIDIDKDAVSKVLEEDEGIPDELVLFSVTNGKLHTINSEEEARKIQPPNPGVDFVVVLSGMATPWIINPIDIASEEQAVEIAIQYLQDRSSPIGFFAKRIGDLPNNVPVFETIYRLDSSVLNVSEIEEALAATPDDLRQLTIGQLDRFYTFLHQFHLLNFDGNANLTADGASREDLINTYAFLLQEMKRRGRLPRPKDELDSETKDLVSDIFKRESGLYVTTKEAGHSHFVDLQDNGSGDTDFMDNHSHSFIDWKMKPSEKVNHIHKVAELVDNSEDKSDAKDIEIGDVAKTDGPIDASLFTNGTVQTVDGELWFVQKTKKNVDKILKKQLPIIKSESNGDERIVYGVVLEPETVDSQDDIYSEQEIRDCAHRFMEEFRHLGVMHEMRMDDRLKILESYIAPADLIIEGQAIKKGTWLMVIRVLDDGLWRAVKDKELTGLSIGGSALRKPVDGDTK